MSKGITLGALCESRYGNRGLADRMINAYQAAVEAREREGRTNRGQALARDLLSKGYGLRRYRGKVVA